MKVEDLVSIAFKRKDLFPHCTGYPEPSRTVFYISVCDVDPRWNDANVSAGITELTYEESLQRLSEIMGKYHDSAEELLVCISNTTNMRVDDMRCFHNRGALSIIAGDFMVNIFEHARINDERIGEHS